MKYPDPPAFCKKDWQMHSCALLYGHDGDHVCPCGERRPQPSEGTQRYIASGEYEGEYENPRL